MSNKDAVRNWEIATNEMLPMATLFAFMACFQWESFTEESLQGFFCGCCGSSNAESPTEEPELARLEGSTKNIQIQNSINVADKLAHLVTLLLKIWYSRGILIFLEPPSSFLPVLEQQHPFVTQVLEDCALTFWLTITINEGHKCP